MAEKAAKGQEEPSIEEILGSIRRIIAEDDEPGAAPAAPSVKAVEPDPMEEEPLELTEKIDADGTISAAAEPARKEPTVVEEDTKLVFVEEEPVVVAVVPAPPVKEEKPMADEILSDNAANATANAMAKLARATPIAEEGNDGISVESIVRETLKPLLKEWLDKNLPDLVQKMVERELEKLSKRI